jgi:hypothetical protein
MLQDEGSNECNCAQISEGWGERMRNAKQIFGISYSGVLKFSSRFDEGADAMKFSPYRMRISGLVFASALMVMALNGCQSKQDAAIEQAKKQAASTGQVQTVTTTDKNGNTVTTTVQPPAPGQKDEVVTTTVTPKAANPAQAAATPDATAGATAGSAAAPATTAAAAPPPAPAPPPTVNVPAGTPLAIRIDHTISAKHSRAGERFAGEIVDPVTGGNGNVLIPKGSDVGGVVVVAHKRGHFKGASTLELRLTSLTLNGKTYPLETRDFREHKKGKGKRTAGLIAGGSGLGMLIGGVASGGTGLVIGGLAGAGAGTAGAGLTGNRDLVIPAESIVHFKLSDDLEIQP